MRHTLPFHRLRSILFDLSMCGLALGSSLVDALEPGGYWALFAVLKSLVASAALGWRRRYPVAVFAIVATVVSAVIGAVFLAGKNPSGSPANVVVVYIAMYSVVKYARRLRDGVIVGLLVVIGALATTAMVDWGSTAGGLVMGFLAVAVAGLVWASGLAMRNRRLYIESLEDRAVTAERERDNRAQLAVAQERAAIARELHDVVAHSLAVMIVQSDGARYAFDRNPDQAKAALETIAGTGREALEEMRRLVAILRSGGTQPADASGELGGSISAAVGSVGDAATVDRPRAALDQIAHLVERARAARLLAELDVRGAPAGLSVGVELAVYRIVQEAVTNAIKHAGPGSSLRVRVVYSAEAVEISVRDTGPADVTDAQIGAPVPSGGNGLVGLRERVALYGGTWSAGAQLDGGWLVNARIPMRAADPAGAPSGAAQGRPAQPASGGYPGMFGPVPGAPATT